MLAALVSPRPMLPAHPLSPRRRVSRSSRSPSTPPATPERKRKAKSSWLRAFSPRADSNDDELSSSAPSREAAPIAGPSVPPRRSSGRQPITRYNSSPGSLRSEYESAAMSRDSSADSLAERGSAGFLTPMMPPPSLHESASLNTRFATRSESVVSPRVRDYVEAGDEPQPLDGLMVDVLLGPAFAELSLADRRYAASLRILHRLQMAAESPTGQATPRSARRTVSLPSLHEAMADEVARPTADLARPRVGWSAIGAILRPSPTLPNMGPISAAMDLSDDSDAEETRMAVLSAAIDTARTARDEVLDKLSAVAILARTLRAVTSADDDAGSGMTPAYSTRLMAIALALVARVPACLVLLDADQLAELRSAACTLMQSFERARPGANARQVPQRGSSLPTGEPDLVTVDIVVQGVMVHEAFVSFDLAYSTFEHLLTRSYVRARELRMSRRAARREERVRMAAMTLRCEPDSASAAITVLPTADLARVCLDRALAAGLVSAAEVSSLDPRCFVVLPRLCTLWGIETADLPSDWASRPIAFFLPRIARSIPSAVILRVRALAPQRRRDRLAALLAGTQGTPRLPADNDAEVVAIYRDIAAAADRGSQGSGARSWAKLMSRLLRQGADAELAQEEIARELDL